MLRTRITETMKSAMKAKEQTALSTARLIQAALKDRDIAARSKGNMDGISDDEILSMLQSMIKQRRDSIEMYEKGDRPELAEREAQEIDVIVRNTITRAQIQVARIHHQPVHRSMRDANSLRTTRRTRRVNHICQAVTVSNSLQVINALTCKHFRISVKIQHR